MNKLSETILVRLSPEERQRLETEARSLHLTVDALAALRVRGVPDGFTPERWDRVLSEVFGRYGDVIRRLA